MLIYIMWDIHNNKNKNVDINNKDVNSLKILFGKIILNNVFFYLGVIILIIQILRSSHN